MSSPIETYKLFSDFYDLYVGSFDADFEFYTTCCKNAGSILEIGCGTGRVLNRLLQLDSKLTGADISPDMLKKASGRFAAEIAEGRLNLITHDFTNSKLSQQFDRLLLTFYTFNYILDQPTRFLSNARSSLSSKGLLLMDMFYPNTLADRSIDGVWLEKEFVIGNTAISLKDCRSMNGELELRQQVFTINGTETKIDTIRRYYSPQLMKELCKEAGFSKTEFSAGYNYAAFGEDAEGIRMKDNYIVKAYK